MSTSGTTSFAPDLTEIIEEAYARTGYVGRTGYDFRSARMSLGLVLSELANRGMNLWSVASGTIPLVAGTATYDLPEDTVDLIEHVVRTGTGNSQVDISMSRISVSTYATLPNKNNTGKPIQVYINRQSPVPTITLWPVPDSSAPYTLAYWRLRRLQDAGNGSNTQDVPFRFVPALIAGLAYHLSMKVPGGLERAAILKAQFDEALMLAEGEDRDRSPVRLVPRVGHI